MEPIVKIQQVAPLRCAHTQARISSDKLENFTVPYNDWLPTSLLLMLEQPKPFKCWQLFIKFWVLTCVVRWVFLLRLANTCLVSAVLTELMNKYYFYLLFNLCWSNLILSWWYLQVVNQIGYWRTYQVHIRNMKSSYK